MSRRPGRVATWRAHVLDSIQRPPEWMRQAACADSPQLPWTDEHEDTRGYPRRVMAGICRDCPVLADCDQYATSTHQAAGFWAGRPRYHGTSCTKGARRTRSRRRRPTRSWWLCCNSRRLARHTRSRRPCRWAGRSRSQAPGPPARPHPAAAGPLAGKRLVRCSHPGGHPRRRGAATMPVRRRWRRRCMPRCAGTSGASSARRLPWGAPDRSSGCGCSPRSRTWPAGPKHSTARTPD